MKVLEYKLVFGKNISASSLQMAVNKAIEEGWEPIGSPFYINHIESPLQAMIKYKKRWFK